MPSTEHPAPRKPRSCCTADPRRPPSLPAGPRTRGAVGAHVPASGQKLSLCPKAKMPSETAVIPPKMLEPTVRMLPGHQPQGGTQTPSRAGQPWPLNASEPHLTSDVRAAELVEKEPQKAWAAWHDPAQGTKEGQAGQGHLWKLCQLHQTEQN